MGTKCYYQAPCQRISDIPLRRWPNGYKPPLQPCCTSALKICYFGLFFPPGVYLHPHVSELRVHWTLHLYNGWVKSNTRSQGQARQVRDSTGRWGVLHELQHFLGSCCYTFREEPAEGTRSSFASHWKASQSARAFADKPKALPRTFGSLGKFYFSSFAILTCPQQH